MGMSDRIQPESVQLRIAGNRIRLDILGDGLIDVALAQLRISPSGPVADQLMGQRSAASGEHEIPDRMFQNRAVSDFQNMVQVGFIAAGARPGETHVTDAPRHFDQMFAGAVRIGLPTDAMIREKALDNLGIDDLAANQIDTRLTDDTDISNRVEISHQGRSQW